jgi:hypothetical protein
VLGTSFPRELGELNMIYFQKGPTNMCAPKFRVHGNGGRTCAARPYDRTDQYVCTKIPCAWQGGTSDITSLPPIPPQAPVRQADVSRPIPDSLILAMGGTLPNSNTSGNSGSPAPPSTPQPPSPPVYSCGFATASRIGVLRPLYPNSFIVRTYQPSQEVQCNATALPFFFKVCHR